jgi:hypothetical protein
MTRVRPRLLIVVVSLFAAGPLGEAGASSEAAASNSVRLDALPRGGIADPFGPPRANASFGEAPLKLAGRSFEHGLGTHAPSVLELRLDGRALLFEAVVGVDEEVQLLEREATRGPIRAFPRYVYDGSRSLLDFAQGGTVAFKVIVDGRVAFDSGRLDAHSAGVPVRVGLAGAKRLRLVVEDAGDGSFADHADWADARLELAPGASTTGLRLEHRAESVLVNHVGFLPLSPKSCVVDDDVAAGAPFEVVDDATGTVAFRGALVPVRGDWGDGATGDFTRLSRPGRYFVRAGERRSGPFEIGADVYRVALERHLSAFTAQRSGDPDHGWAKGRHLDDGRRRDDGRHQDVSGGWYDACDLRKWSTTVLGLWALVRVAETTTEPALRDRIVDEIRWGNRFFLAMQEPEGYLMAHAGGDIAQNADNNYWTDNVPGTWDDRAIDTKPADPVLQFVFVESEARIARLLAASDPGYAVRCREAARQAWSWAERTGVAQDAISLAAAVGAAVALEGLPGERPGTDALLDRLLALQVARTTGPEGWFRTSPEDAEPARDLISDSRLILGLVDLVGARAGAPVGEKARGALRRLVHGWLLPLAARQPYGIVPFGPYAKDPGGARRAGDVFYRWAYDNHGQTGWWNGINPHLAGIGVGLARAATLLGEPALLEAAQRQLDWVYGANPFDASTATGLGRRQPALFRTSEFSPPTPEIPGEVMAGIGTTVDDQPVLDPGWWNTTEYWTPPLAHTMLLVSELMQRARPATPEPQPRRFFADASFWNQPLPQHPEPDPRSDHYVSLLAKEPSGGFGINLFKWTIPVYAVDAATPRYRIAKHALDAAERQIWQSSRETFGHGPGFDDGVPIPKAALPDPEQDAHFAVVDWKAKRAWDTWGFRVRKDGTFESNTGMTYALDGEGVFRTADFAVKDGESIHFHGPSRAAGVPAIAGLILHDEVLSGEIRHKLACAIRCPALQEFVWPASWTDGPVRDGIPEGAVIQLDPGLDLSSFDLLPGERAVARALQRYGMVIVDYADGSTLYGEGLWGSPTKSWQGILRDHGQGLDRIGAEHYRVLRLPPVTRKGDARSLRRPYTLPQYAPPAPPGK